MLPPAGLLPSHPGFDGVVPEHSSEHGLTASASDLVCIKGCYAYIYYIYAISITILFCDLYGEKNY